MKTVGIFNLPQILQFISKLILKSTLIKIKHTTQVKTLKQSQIFNKKKLKALLHLMTMKKLWIRHTNN